MRTSASVLQGDFTWLFALDCYPARQVVAGWSRRRSRVCSFSRIKPGTCDGSNSSLERAALGWETGGCDSASGVEQIDQQLLRTTLLSRHADLEVKVGRAGTARVARPHDQLAGGDGLAHDECV